MNKIALFILSTENYIDPHKDTSYLLMLEAQKRGLKILIEDLKVSIKKNDFVKYNLIDSKYHNSFFDLSSNRFLIKNYENINSIIETIRTHSIQGLVDKDKLTSSNNGHILIHKNIEEKNLTLALHELDRHINSWFDDRIIKSCLTS